MVIKFYCSFFAFLFPIDLKPIRGLLLDTIDTWPKYWFVEFNLTVHSMDEDPEDSQPNVNGDYFSVLHFTKGADDTGFGDRVPSFFLKKSHMHIRPVVDIENAAYGGFITDHIPIQFGRKYSFKLFSREVWSAHKTQIFVDGQLSVEENHFGQQEFLNNVKVYVSDPWYQAPDVTLSDLRYGPYQP